MKRSKMPILIALAIPVALASFWLVSTSRAATETADYKVIRRDGVVEIRDYPALTVATAPMGDGDMDRGFGKLFRFITGSNEQSKKIAMTTPVLIESASEKKTMSFIMPKEAVANGVPKPTGENVSLGKVEAARFAALRFSGGRTAKNEAKATEKLKAWLDGNKIAGNGAIMFAYYDPPWTPFFMRRNEAMIRVDRQAGDR